MSRIILVTGGARSGKSSFAEQLFKDSKDVVYIATSRICDEEMEDRVKMHKQRRPKEWKTFEGSYDLSKSVSSCKNYLLDCLTIMSSNIMFDITGECENVPIETQKRIEDKVMYEITQLIDSVKGINGNLIMVTNEVGSSIVPENHIARVYRDIIGRINQRTAALSSEVYSVTCGIPLRLK